MKTVKVTKEDLQQISNALEYLNSKETEAWYGVGRNLQFIKQPLADLYKEKDVMFDKLAEKDEKGNIKYDMSIPRQPKVIFNAENEKKADEIWDELKTEEVEIKVYKISQSTFGKVKLNGKMLLPLMDIILVD